MPAIFFLPQIPDSGNVPQQPDTIASGGGQGSYSPGGTNDSAVGYFPAIPIGALRQHAAAVTFVPVTPADAGVTVSSPIKADRIEWNTNKNFFQQNGLTGIVNGVENQLYRKPYQVFNIALKPPVIMPQQRNPVTYDWMLGIFMLLIVLFVWIRIFYGKFFATLASSLISFQISAKLFRERNVLLQRVSIVLDFIYVIVFSVFAFELLGYFGLPRAGLNGFNLYLLLLNIVILYALFRILLLRFSGFLFLVKPLFSEYIHNTFVVNKGMGIALFPVVIMAQYLPHELIPVVLVLGVIIFAVAFIWKGIRAYQIIIRKDVLLFYLILYLCTLEILPLLLGYKFVTSLI